MLTGWLIETTIQSLRGRQSLDLVEEVDQEEVPKYRAVGVWVPMTGLPPKSVEGHTHSRVASRGGFEHLLLWPERSDVICNTPYRNPL